MTEKCSYMFNSWKRCDRPATADGLCGIHHPRNEAAYARGVMAWRRTG